MNNVVLALSLLSVILGACLACAAPRVPAFSMRLEQYGGTLFVYGLALLGTALPRLC
ncbi:MAG TPA: hypothetical protein VKV77_09390 [Methylovirgula sp.]|nr:hypothetical protein [Methylovirgula sp.]